MIQPLGVVRSRAELWERDGNAKWGRWDPPANSTQQTMALLLRSIAQPAALHLWHSNRLHLTSSVDADLLTVVLAWERISDPIRKGICALVQQASFT